MDRFSTLLSVRIAQILSSTHLKNHRGPDPVAAGLVMTLQTDAQSWEPHRELLDTLGLQNNLISYQKVGDNNLS